MEFLKPGVPVTVPLVPTTFGWMHPSMVRKVECVVADNEDHKIVRTDKYTLDGQWCGNDLDVQLKRWPDGMAAVPGMLGG